MPGWLKVGNRHLREEDVKEVRFFRRNPGAVPMVELRTSYPDDSGRPMVFAVPQEDAHDLLVRVLARSPAPSANGKAGLVASLAHQSLSRGKEVERLRQALHKTTEQLHALTTIHREALQAWAEADDLVARRDAEIASLRRELGQCRGLKIGEEGA
jgi:hypothetical protein